MEALNPYEPPPKCLKDAFKVFHSMKELGDDSGHIDLNSGSLTTNGDTDLSAIHVNQIFCAFLQTTYTKRVTIKKYAPGIPGFTILPSLLPPEVQRKLLDRLFHRDLSNSNHKTNLHLHYDVSYPEDRISFFSSSPSDVSFEPKDPRVHKRLQMKQVFDKKLRWMTLGGQYDWTQKVYPTEKPPDFPKDIADLVHGICPWMVPQAAITNVYSPGDTLSLHRDVSEEVDAGLVSISLGCDCLFMIGVKDDSKETGYHFNTIRLHSGDVVFMEGSARFAWHGVPKILPNTCPSYLSSWPSEATETAYPQWADWMKNKRINLNVRQMRSMSAAKSEET